MKQSLFFDEIGLKDFLRNCEKNKANGLLQRYVEYSGCVILYYYYLSIFSFFRDRSSIIHIDYTPYTLACKICECGYKMTDRVGIFIPVYCVCLFFFSRPL
jgi:hypothetical protein